MDIWKVKETPCYPNSFKVYPINTYRETNDTSNYFPTIELAKIEADKRND